MTMRCTDTRTHTYTGTHLELLEVHFILFVPPLLGDEHGVVGPVAVVRFGTIEDFAPITAAVDCLA